MKPRICVVLLAFACAAASLCGCASTKWEYRKFPEHDEKTMNVRGAGGWELVGLDPSDGMLIYKRPVDSGSSMP